MVMNQHAGQAYNFFRRAMGLLATEVIYRLRILAQLRMVRPREHEALWLYGGQTFLHGHDRQGRPIFLQRTGLASHRFAELYAFFGGGAEPLTRAAAGRVAMLHPLTTPKTGRNSSRRVERAVLLAARTRCKPRCCRPIATTPRR